MRHDDDKDVDMAGEVAGVGGEAGYLEMDPYMACIWSDLGPEGISLIVGATYDDQPMINIYDQWANLMITMDSEGRIYAKEFIDTDQVTAWKRIKDWAVGWW